MQARTDIQALRGLAVLLVVFNHAGLGPFKAGYLGVDIFFVISGFLITGLIKKEIEAGNFSFQQFYLRRTKRLLPAALATFLATAVCAPFLLDATELRLFAKQLVGAVTFMGNVALLLQADYFGGEAQLKPLLHVWSLSVEEQFYLVLPAALVFTPRRFWLAGTVAVLLASLTLCLVGAQLKPVATFYLLPTRAWELCIGSIAARGGAILLTPRLQAVVRHLFRPAVAALIALPVFPIGSAHPGADAFIACISTLVVILRNHPIGVEPLWLRGLARVGDFSYSLYLAHWPVFAFMNNFYMGKSIVANWTALGIAFGLGALLYRCVEAPVRRMEVRSPSRLVVGAVAGSMAVAALPFAFAAAENDASYAHVRRINVGLDVKCNFKQAFAPLSECRTSPGPRLMVWGDSYAMHLVAGLAATTDVGLVQATHSSCAPIIGLALVLGNDRAEARSCMEFNASVVEYLRSASSVEVVVLSSPFSSYLSGTYSSPHAVLAEVEGQVVEQSPSVASATEHLLRTVNTVRALGKRVVIVAPPPSTGTDIGQCLESKATGKLTVGAEPDCAVPMDDYRRAEQQRLSFLDSLPQRGVDVIRMDDVLCANGRCVTEIDGTFVYRDSGHLSYDGSVLIARRMQLGTQAWRRAK